MKPKRLNTVKKWLRFLLACILLTALLGCGTRNEANSAPTEQPTAESSVVATEQSGQE